MQASLPFNDVLEAIDGLTLEEQEEVASLLRQRLIEYRRNQLSNDVQAARRELEEGRCAQVTAAGIMGEITQ